SFPFVAERLLLELRVKEGDNPPARLGGLGLAPGHPSFWGSLPTDAAIYSPLADPALAAPGAELRPPLSPRFALAGGPDAGLSIPVGELLQLAFLDPFADGRSAAARDGLTVFDRSLFFDARLVDAGTSALFSRAEFVRYQSSREIQALRGMHSAFFIDEISIAAAPDAVHRRWQTTDETHVGPDSPPHAPPPPHATPADCPPAGPFRVCNPCTLDAPRLSSAVGESGRITLTWTGAGTRFAVEESVGPEFAQWAPVTTGTRQELDIYDRPPGEYAYRVTASTEDGRVSTPSDAAFVVVPGRQRAVFDDDYENGDLLDIHRALVRMCAARGDAVALLGLPEHYREDAAIDHVRALTTGPAGATAPLNPGEAPALSYAAIYHPWLVVTESGALRRQPPDGPAAGLL